MSFATRRMTALFMAFVMFTCMLFTIPANAAYAAAKKPAKVKGLSMKLSGNTIKVSWKKAKNAKKYQLYVRIGSASWKLKKTLKKTTFTINAKKGVIYSFKVRGVNGKKKGSFSAVKKVTIPEEEKPVDPEEEVDGNIVIISQPEPEAVHEGDEATFSVEAEGKNLQYQWFESKNGTNTTGKAIEGATDSTLTIIAELKYRESGFYCVVSNNSSARRTELADLMIILGNYVYVMKQPEDQIVYEGDEAVFETELTGTGEYFYQWYKNDKDSNEGGEKLEGQTTNRLSIDASLADDGSYYYCKVRDEISRNVTEAAKLNVEISPARKQMVNDLRAFIDENGVLSTETIEIDGDEYYVLAVEDNKVLVLMKGIWGTIQWYRITAFGRWDDDTKTHNTRYALNTTYLKKHNTIKIMAAEVANLTADNRPSDNYYVTMDKGFILTEADVLGTVNGCDAKTQDFSFDRTESHIGKALPKDIALVYDEEGNNIVWWVRSPQECENVLFPDSLRVAADENGNVAVQKKSLYYPSIRPAVWLDLSIE